MGHVKRLSALLPALLLAVLAPPPAQAGDAVTRTTTAPAQATGASPSSTGGPQRQMQRRPHADRPPASPAVSSAEREPTARAGHARPANPPLTLGEGLSDRSLWLDSSRVAEFDAGGAAEPTLVNAEEARYTLQMLAKSLDGSAPEPGGTAAQAADLRSPVFVDASGRARALPGGVIVTLKAGTDPDADGAALAAAGLQPVRHLSGRSWLVASEPGLAALALARRLQDDGQFERVQPNWWVTRQRK